MSDFVAFYLVLAIGAFTGWHCRPLLADLAVAWRNHRRIKAWKRSRLVVPRRNRWR